MTALWAALLLGVLSGGVAINLAQMKGRNPSHWFLWAFFFTFVALVVLALTQDETATLPKNRLGRHL